MFPHPALASRVIKAKDKHEPQHSSLPAIRTDRGMYKTWTSESLEYALDAVQRGTSFRVAAEVYGIPRATLMDYNGGRSTIGCRQGSTYLTEEEEEELVSFLFQVAQIGYPRTKKEVMATVQQIIDSKGIDRVVTNGWWNRFYQRHPNVTLKSAVPLSYSRAKAATKEVLDSYFDVLYDCLVANDILDKPGAIYNCDETGLPMNPSCHKVVDKAGSKHPSYLTSGAKQQYTVLACTNAAGTALPPFIVLDQNSFNVKFTAGEVPGTVYGLSTNGWMTQELFAQWFTGHFLHYATSDRPIILIMDGHSSHYSPATIRLAAENQVILFVLPPNTTHATQPLDRGCFSPLKSAWRETCHKFTTAHPGKKITKFDFCRLFAEAWYKAMTLPNIISSYRVTGIYPFNRLSLIGTDAPTKFDPLKLVGSSGLAYIPLYSPSRGKRLAEAKSREDGVSSAVSSPSVAESVSVPLRQKTSISDFLVKPPPCMPAKGGKVSSQILTSRESMKLLQEKQEAKEMKEQQRLEKQKMRAEKAREKELAKLKKMSEKGGSVSQRVGEKKEKKCTNGDKRAMLNSDGKECAPDRTTAKKQVSEVIIVDDEHSPSPLNKQRWWLKDLRLDFTDKEHLLTGTDLTDSIMNAAQNILREHFPQWCGFQDTTLGELLSFRPVALKKGSVAVQILHTGESKHWVCAAVMKDSTVVLMDSLWTEDTLERSVELQIAQMFGPSCAKENTLTIKKLAVQQQQVGTHDCGLFAVAYATEVCFGKDPALASYDQSKMSTHLVECFEQGKLTRFPQVSRLNKKLRPAGSISMELQLFCYCNMPEDYDNMVECDGCAEWFHQSCVGITDLTKRQLQKLQWFCNDCKGGSLPSVLQGKPQEFLPKFTAKKRLRQKKVASSN